ncbi:tetraspanin-33-like [Haemaphysalis longicornis]
MFQEITSIPLPKKDETTVIVDVNPLYRMPLMFVNLFFFIVSSAVTVVCILALVDRADTVSFRNRSFLVNMMVNLEVPIILFFGSLLIISFIGFMGTLRENLCMLSWYNCILNGLGTLTLVLLFLCAVITFVSRNSAKSLFTIDLITSYRDNPDFARLIDYAQKSFQCCGVTDEHYRSWRHNIYFACNDTNPSKERCSVPPSCCKPSENPDLETRLQGRFCGRGVLRLTEQEAWNRIYTRSCVDATVAYISANVIIIAVILVGVLFFFGSLRFLTIKVSEQIEELTEMYDKYYEQKQVLKAEELMKNQKPPEPVKLEKMQSAATQPGDYRTGVSVLGSQILNQDRRADQFLLGPRPTFARQPVPLGSRLP